MSEHVQSCSAESSAETAIAALAKRFWSIHPSTLDDMGLTREEFYASEMVKLFGALTRNEPQEAPDSLREALDNSQSLLVMMLELGEEYQAATIGRDPAGITEAVWNAEGLTKMLTEQITDNRAALSLSRPQQGTP